MKSVVYKKQLGRRAIIAKQRRQGEVLAAVIVVLALAIGFYVIAAIAAHDAEVQVCQQSSPMAFAQLHCEEVIK